MPDQLVRTRSSVERMERLVEVVQRRARERAQRFVGRTVEVLVEGPSRTDPTRLRGRTRHNKAVNFDGTAAPGELVDGRDHERHVADARRPREAPEQSPRAPEPAGMKPSSRSSARPGSARPPSRSRSPSGLRERGEDPVAVSGDALQVYRGPRDAERRGRAPEQRERLEHRLVGFVPVTASSAPGGTRGSRTRRSTRSPRGAARSSSAAPGLYLRAALAELDLRPPRPRDLRARVEARDRRARARGAARRAATARPRPRRVDPNDRKRVARAAELQRAGIEPPRGTRGSCGRRDCATRRCSSG